MDSALDRAFDEATRERLVDEFRACLERSGSQASAGEASASESLQAARAPVDLATLLGEMAVLKSELRLQSRQFKNTLEELRLFGNDLRAHSERLQNDVERARAAATAIQRRTERQFLLALLDLRDRLQNGVDAAQRPPASFFTRLLPGPTRFAASLAEGQRLTLQRLDERLSGDGVRPFPVLGERFDPERMRAVGVESAAENPPDGTVLREVQRGFFHNGEILRIAQVIVSKKATRT